jgi:hypothetical protein
MSLSGGLSVHSDKPSIISKVNGFTGNDKSLKLMTTPKRRTIQSFPAEVPAGYAWIPPEKGSSGKLGVGGLAHG